MIKNKKLERLRKEIDLVDRNISGLICKRLSIASQIRKVKKANQIKIEDKNRERIVINKVKKAVKSTKQKRAISNIYKEIIKQTKLLER